MSTVLYIVRHAESAGNSGGMLCGHVNVDISAEGEKQLEYLAKRFKDIHFDAIYTSPLLRARKTAAAVNKYHGLEIVPDEGIIELCCGVLDGMLWTKIKSDYPEQYRIWREEAYNFDPPEGESFRHLYDRIWDSAMRLGRAHDGQTVVLSTHGGAMRCLLCRLEGKPVEELGSIGIIENTGFIRVIYDNGKLSLDAGPDASHLPEELCTVGRQAEYRAAK